MLWNSLDVRARRRSQQKGCRFPTGFDSFNIKHIKNSLLDAILALRCNLVVLYGADLSRRHFLPEAPTTATMVLGAGDPMLLLSTMANLIYSSWFYCVWNERFLKLIQWHCSWDGTSTKTLVIKTIKTSDHDSDDLQDGPRPGAVNKPDKQWKCESFSWGGSVYSLW